MKSVIENLRQLGVPRLAALGGVAITTLILLGVLVLKGASTDSLLYRDLDAHEAGKIVDQLDKAHIAYRLADNGETIFVPEENVASARLLLAKNGLPSGGSVGYEIFDKGNGFTATQFEQTINETRALEGELERSIRLISGVENVRVHLVLRHRELFSTEEQGAQASILLSMRGARRMDSEGVSAIVNLVSAAVPGLETRNISLIDNRGHVLLKEGAGTPDAANSPEEQRQALEQRISRSIEDILESSVGAGHIRVEANVSMDNNHVHETDERYDPDQQVLRSQQTKSEKNINSQGNVATTVTNNLPNASAGQPQSGSQSTRQEQTDNYEIGKTVRTISQDQPRIARVSVAVIVDEVSKLDAKGKETWQPRDAAELDRLTALAKGAMGFDQSRGDVVTVVSMKFAEMPLAASPESNKILGMSVPTPERMQLVKLGLFLLCLLSILYFVVRPLLKPTSGGISGSILQGSGANASQLGSGKDLSIVDIATTDAPLALDYAGESGGETVQLKGVEGQIRAASVQKIMALVEQHPGETIALMRGWLSQEHEKGGVW